MPQQFSAEESKSFQIGLIAVFVFCIIFFLMAFSTNDYKHIDRSYYFLNATFGRTDGLLVGDKVRMAGVDIGRVVDAHLDQNFNAILKLEISDDLKIPEDSSASIVSSGLMGNKYIEIEPGGSEDFLSPNDEFNYTQDAIVLEELLERIVALGKTKNKKNKICQPFEEDL